jgi:hypothetical protein
MNAKPDRFRDWDAAYVLGLLSAEDRRTFEIHLKSCPTCATAVAELAGMPALLGAITSDQARLLVAGSSLPGTAHEPSLVAALAHRVSRRRVRRRIVSAAFGLAAAFLLICAGTAIGSTAGTVPPVAATAAPLAEMTAVGASTMSASLGITEKGWGTRLDWTCEYSSQSPYTGSYELVVTTKDGQQRSLASWSTTSGDHAGGLSASTSLRTSEITSIDIRFLGAASALVETRL